MEPNFSGHQYVIFVA